MSLETWKAEFYPIEAAEVETERHAAQHSLQKWIGLRPENMKRHEVFQVMRSVKDRRDRLCVDQNSCALCQVHQDSCSACALADFTNSCAGPSYPYSVWGRDGNPEPMIAALQKIQS